MVDYAKLRPGPNNVGSYQISSIPYMSSTITVPRMNLEPLKLTLPSLSRFVTIKNTIPSADAAAPIRIGFASGGVGENGDVNYFVLANQESYTGDWRIIDIFMMGDNATTGGTASVVAGLTGIQVSADWTNWVGIEGIGG